MVRRPLSVLAVFAAIGLFSSGASASEPCPNEAVRQEQGSTRLPDCRAYELVSPEHQGFPTGAGPGSPIPNQRVWVPAEGDRVIYSSPDPFTGDSGLPGTFESRRGDGWSTTGLLPTAPQSFILKPISTFGISDNGTKVILQTNAPLVEGDTNGEEDVYLFDEVTKTLTWISTGASTEARYQGRSADASHILFETASNLVPGASGEALKLYEWVDGTTRLAGILPGGVVPAGGSVLGDRDEGAFTMLPINAVSTDGSLVYFTSPAPSHATPANPIQVYVRENGTSTVEVSASQCTRPDCNTQADVLFQGASRDGSHVYLATTQQLTNDDTDEGNDLYSYDRVTGELIRISAGVGALVQGGSLSVVLGSSDDGQRVYFRGGGPERPIYLWDHGSLKEIGIPDFYLMGADQNCEESIGGGTPEVTPSGNALVFSTTSFTTAVSGPSGPGLYRYDASSEELTRIASSGSLAKSPNATTDVECPLRKTISEDGSTVFFMTEEALVPWDVNGLSDVYEWHDGQLSLISSGAGSLPDEVLGTGRDGTDVFFTATDPLAPQDRDTVQDVYDARIDGGFPSPSVSGDCTGDGCRTLAEPPGFTDPGSPFFVGSGNSPAPPARKTIVKPLTNAQRLSKALRACMKRKKKAQRKKCELQASKRYAKKASKSSRGSK